MVHGMFITGPGMQWALMIIFIIHKNMACCGFVACSILTSDLYVTMEACLKSGFQIRGVGVQSPPPPLARVSPPLGN